MLKIDLIRNHLVGITFVTYLASPLDNIWNLPLISLLPVVTLSFLIASLGMMEVFKATLLFFIFFWLGSLGLMGISFYSIKTAVAISFFLVLFRKEFSVDPYLLLRYVTVFALTLFLLMLVSIIDRFDLYLGFLTQLDAMLFLDKDMDIYYINSALKFQWLLGDAKSAQRLFTGITLFLPFFIWIMLSLYLRHRRVLTSFICFLPLAILFSRSALLFGLIYLVAHKEKYRAFTFVGVIISVFIFYYYAYTYNPEFLRGRNKIIEIILSNDINLWFGTGPGYLQQILINEVGQGSLHNIFLELFLAYGIIGTLFTILLICFCYFKNKSSSIALGLTFIISFGLFNFNIAEIAFLGVGVLLTKIDTSNKRIGKY